MPARSTSTSPLRCRASSFSGGTLGGTGDLTITGPFTVSGAASSITGPGQLTTSGTTTVGMSVPSGYVYLAGRNWRNTGTLTVGDDDRILFTGGGSTLTNAAGGVLNLSSSDDTPLIGDGGTYTVVNEGTLNQTAAGSHAIGSGISVLNSGTVNVASGLLSVDGDIALQNLTLGIGGTTPVSGHSVLATGGAVKPLWKLNAELGRCWFPAPAIVPGAHLRAGKPVLHHTQSAGPRQRPWLEH